MTYKNLREIVPITLVVLVLSLSEDKNSYNFILFTTNLFVANLLELSAHGSTGSLPTRVM